MRGTHLGHEVAGVCQDVRLRLELLVLPRGRADRGDLVDSVAQQGRLALALLPAADQVVQLAARAPPGRMRLSVVVDHAGHVVAGEAIEQVALPSRVADQQLVGLAVDGDEPLGDLRECRGRHAASAGEGPAAPLGGHRPAEQQDEVVARALRSGPGLVKSVGDLGVLTGREVPLAVDVGPLGARAHDAGVRLAAP